VCRSASTIDHPRKPKEVNGIDSPVAARDVWRSEEGKEKIIPARKRIFRSRVSPCELERVSGRERQPTTPEGVAQFELENTPLRCTEMTQLNLEQAGASFGDSGLFSFEAAFVIVGYWLRKSTSVCWPARTSISLVFSIFFPLSSH
jgi:hypothetical protein